MPTTVWLRRSWEWPSRTREYLCKNVLIVYMPLLHHYFSVDYQIDKESKTIRRLEFIKAEGRHILYYIQSHMINHTPLRRWSIHKNLC